MKIIYLFYINLRLKMLKEIIVKRLRLSIWIKITNLRGKGVYFMVNIIKNNNSENNFHH